MCVYSLENNIHVQNSQKGSNTVNSKMTTQCDYK